MYNEAVMNKRQKFKIYWQFSGTRNDEIRFFSFSSLLLQRSTNDEGLGKRQRTGKWKEKRHQRL